LIGTELNHYKILRELGRGGMGAVYAAEDTKLGRQVALKVLPAELADDPERLDRFQREARAVAALNHPNIVVLHSVEESAGTHFLTMELVEGQPMSELIPGGGLPLESLVENGTALAEAMSAAHDQGIVHRDLKPANVMVNNEGRLKVLDFGLAKLAEPIDWDNEETQLLPTDLTGEGRIIGTVAYMSPEQAEGKPVDTRTDVFSFGVLLYQMATGKLPFFGGSSASTMAKILETEPEPPSQLRTDLPPNIERIIGRCLEKQPSDRYNDTRDLVADLRSLQPTGERRVPALGTGARGSSARWMVAAILAAIVAVLFIAVLPRSDDEPDSADKVLVAGTKPSVAVLPFHNLSGEEENAYFSAGMTEEIISKLSRIDALEVASRGSVARFTDPVRDPQQIGAELGVGYLLDGSVRRAGDRVRVSAQLVDAATGRNLWSEDFDGNLEDVFSMQEATAFEIVRRFNLELTPAEERDVGKRLTDNAAAYDAYLKGMSLFERWGKEVNLEKAVEQFELAIDLDPEFAAALAALAGVQAELYRVFDSSEERISQAELLARRAVELDPTLADANNTLGLIAANRYDYRRAAELIREAVRLAPKTALYWEFLAWTLTYQTPPDAEGAEEAVRQAIRLQPISPGAYYQLGRALLAQERFDEAKLAFETALKQGPGFTSGHLGMTQYFLAVGDYDTALRTLDEKVDRRTAITQFYRAAIHAAADQPKQALEALDSSLELGYRDFAALEASQYFEALRSDARYGDLISRYEN
jgi:TolB-like protein